MYMPCVYWLSSSLTCSLHTSVPPLTVPRFNLNCGHSYVFRYRFYRSIYLKPWDKHQAAPCSVHNGMKSGTGIARGYSHALFGSPGCDQTQTKDRTRDFNALTLSYSSKHTGSQRRRQPLTSWSSFTYDKASLKFSVVHPDESHFRIPIQLEWVVHLQVSRVNK